MAPHWRRSITLGPLTARRWRCGPRRRWRRRHTRCASVSSPRSREGSSWRRRRLRRRRYRARRILAGPSRPIPRSRCLSLLDHEIGANPTQVASSRRLRNSRQKTSYSSSVASFSPIPFNRYNVVILAAACSSLPSRVTASTAATPLEGVAVCRSATRLDHHRGLAPTFATAWRRGGAHATLIRRLCSDAILHVDAMDKFANHTLS